MRAERRHGNDERRILAAMIINDSVLGRISQRWEDQKNLFQSRWSNIIAGWCINHYRKYGEAPRNSIQGIFDAWSAKSKNQEASETLDDLLRKVLAEAKVIREASDDYLTDIAGRHFNRVNLSRLLETIKNELESDNVEAASDLVSHHNRIELGQGSIIDPFRDLEAVRRALSSKAESLIKYPGDLGRFFGGSLCRDAFISFMSPEKRGKSYWMLDAAWRGALARYRTAYFIIGDLSEEQIMQRFLVRAARRPLYPGSLQYPIWVGMDDSTREAVAEYKKKQYEGKMEWKPVWKELKKIVKTQFRSNEQFMRLICYPARGVSARGIASILREWERQGWMVDIVVIDYADNLDSPLKYSDPRHQVNDTWIELSTIRQEMHCCLITATQSDAASYDARSLSMRHFSEDKRKLSHVTGMIGLNQTEREKRAGTMRLNWITRREQKSTSEKYVYVAECRDLSRPAVLSTF